MASPSSYLDVPSFKYRTLPKEEWDGARRLEARLIDLHHYCDTFHAALALFDHAAALHAPVSSTRALIKQGRLKAAQDAREQAALYRKWLMIAARDGAMTIYNFDRAIESIPSVLHRCPTLEKLVTHDELRAAKDRFIHHFGSAAAIRLFVAHQAEVFGSDQEIKKHSYSGPVNAAGINLPMAQGLMIGGVLQDRVYSVTTKGEIHQYEISQATLDQLVSVKQAVYGAFKGATGRQRV